MPAGEVLRHGLGLIQQNREGELVGDLAVHLVGSANGDALHVAEDIQLGEGNVGGALHPDTVAGGYQIDGAYPAGTACLGTVLVAGLPQFLGLRAEPLAGEGAFPHAGGGRPNKIYAKPIIRRYDIPAAIISSLFEYIPITACGNISTASAINVEMTNATFNIIE